MKETYFTKELKTKTQEELNIIKNNLKKQLEKVERYLELEPQDRLYQYREDRIWNSIKKVNKLLK